MKHFSRIYILFVTFIYSSVASTQLTYILKPTHEVPASRDTFFPDRIEMHVKHYGRPFHRARAFHGGVQLFNSNINVNQMTPGQVSVAINANTL